MRREKQENSSFLSVPASQRENPYHPVGRRCIAGVSGTRTCHIRRGRSHGLRPVFENRPSHLRIQIPAGLEMIEIRNHFVE